MWGFLSEAALEQALLDQLHGLGYRIEREEDIGPDGHRPERESHDEVVLRRRFEDAVERLNPGVPPEALQHLFDPFFRADPARERSAGGAGLGLAITRRAVEAHHGRVTATNAPDGGLLVEIRLPLTPDDS